MLDAVTASAAPLSRTSAEAHLYLELTGCPACGQPGFDGTSDMVLVDGEVLARYRGRCRRCDTPREYLFRLPAEVPVPLGRHVVFGGPEPSELFDPGEWLAVADLAANRAPIATQEDYALAAAAIDEVLKFIPPGADAVPRSALRTDTGRGIYEREPGRFLRARLEAVAATFRSLAG